MCDAVSDGAKLTKSDAGKFKTLEGIWWCENLKDSLVIQVKFISDSVYYKTNMTKFDSKLTHVIGYEQPDDNLNLDGYSFRLQH